jgi:uncharacterized protein YdaU (DUF1376 family)
MTSRPIWMPLYIADYLADTQHLTTEQHGAYLLLIMAYWQRGHLPDDDKIKAKICGLTRYKFLRHNPTLQSMFTGPEWRHRRIDRELEKANTLKLKRAVFGAKGGRLSRAKNNVERLKFSQLNPSKS